MAISLNLIEGNDYRYTDLMSALDGGSHQFYLPFRGQQVFAAFLNRSKNPKAPNIILVGAKPRVAYAGALLSRQQTPIPVFIKQTTDSWRYYGEFRSSKIIEQHIMENMAKEAERDDVAFGLGLEKLEVEEGDTIAFEEGKCGQVTRNKYERSAEARALCLQHYGYRCFVCDLAFGDEYGERGCQFIHVHHLKPLHENAGPVLTDPKTDLRPVCANCHAMIHVGGKLLTPEELREVYWSAESRSARATRNNKLE